MSARTFYVYVLEDPRDGEVFYVGKGLGLRMHQHAVEARRDKGAGNRRKLQRIKEIQAAGLEPRPRVVAEYADEQDAFDHEADLIAVTPRLTNIRARGGGWAITKDEYERRQAECATERLERDKGELRKRLAVWDEWERRGLIVTFPGLKNGDDLARQCVEAVRALVA